MKVEREYQPITVLLETEEEATSMLMLAHRYDRSVKGLDRFAYALTQELSARGVPFEPYTPEPVLHPPEPVPPPSDWAKATLVDLLKHVRRCRESVSETRALRRGEDYARQHRRVLRVYAHFEEVLLRELGEK